MRLPRAADVVVLTAAVWLPLTGTASAADLDCADFPNQAAAQVVLDADPADPNSLDSNGNRVACEAYGYTAVATTAGQVAVQPTGGVAAGDGSSAGRAPDEGGSPLSYVAGGLAFAAAGGAALAARRASRA
ncbi:hypothetical protein [Modestobacter altitudinis]|uniref:hypothetical protein n=1 Tax=Modestobacter altitudinis TaxID=2213158 RepID=UPI00110D0D81|nr:hypothetical protein [Modestobacter altitudinis]